VNLTRTKRRGRAGKLACAALITGLFVVTFAVGAVPAAVGNIQQPTVSVNGSTLTYTAGPSQINRLVIQDNGDSGGFRVFIVSDSGVVFDTEPEGLVGIQALGPGCSPISFDTARCQIPSSSLPSYNVHLGDLSDYMDVQATEFFGNSAVDGGDGNDTLSGGPGRETFFGGNGIDTVSYSSRTSAITASIGCSSGLFCGPDGASNENDDIRGDVEKVVSGSGSDALTAGVPTTVVHSLDGGPGNDQLLGNLGANVLTGGPGQDILNGFDGNDTLNTNDGEPDSINCGSGSFDVANIDLKDTPQDSSCESVNRAAVDQGPNIRIGSVRLRKRAALTRLTCPLSPEGRCAGTLTVRRIVGTRGRPATLQSKGTYQVLTSPVGSTHYQLATGSAATVRIHVGSATGQVQVTSIEADANGKPKTTLVTRTLAP
jgi:hypothetical protein